MVGIKRCDYITTNNLGLQLMYNVFELTDQRRKLYGGWTWIGSFGCNPTDSDRWSPRTLLHIAAHVNWTNLTDAGAGSLILALFRKVYLIK